MGTGFPPTEETLIRAIMSVTVRPDLQQTCIAALDIVETLVEARASWILLHDAKKDQLVSAACRGAGAGYYQGFAERCDGGIVGLAFTSQRPIFIPDVQQETRWVDPARMSASGLRSVLVVPIRHGGKALGVLGFDAGCFSASHPPTPADLTRLETFAACVTIGLQNARRFADLEEDRLRLRHLLRDRRQLRSEVQNLRSEVRDARAFTEVVGASAALDAVLTEVELVAPADSSVLLLGETGTGKELIARVIHTRSRRSANPFVALNCAALPETLIESELFGYEKGAFTGAANRKAGSFELANRGTLFLDEIGDLPLPAQVKLLRALQEREVMRLGATKPVPVNVRIIAATNQNLDAGLQAGRFRSDLFYRLCVFPIVIPPLRERREDIPVLAAHFVQRFAARLHKDVTALSPEALDRLVAYDWPGNVRELQNVIERAIILARRSVIDADLIVAHDAPLMVARRDRPVVAAADAIPVATLPAADPVISFDEAERRAILRALESTAWRISGPSGAAELLGLKPTTLHAKMKKLGIRRPAPARSHVPQAAESSSAVAVRSLPH